MHFVLRGSVNINRLGALQCERIKSLDKDGNFQTFSYFFLRNWSWNWISYLLIHLSLIPFVSLGFSHWIIRAPLLLAAKQPINKRRGISTHAGKTPGVNWICNYNLLGKPAFFKAVDSSSWHRVKYTSPRQSVFTCSRCMHGGYPSLSAPPSPRASQPP